MKEANDTVSERGLCLREYSVLRFINTNMTYLALGTANTAGAIPMAIGGGLSTFSSLIGVASDNILSAKVVTASGTLIHASPSLIPICSMGCEARANVLA